MLDIIACYLLIGLGFAIFCSFKGAELGSDVPWYGYLITVIVWPYTVYLIIKLKIGESDEK